MAQTTQCPRCGNSNHCAVAAGSSACWCMQERVFIGAQTANATQCFCRDCLRAIANETRPSETSRRE